MVGIILSNQSRGNLVALGVSLLQLLGFLSLSKMQKFSVPSTLLLLWSLYLQASPSSAADCGLNGYDLGTLQA